MAGELVKIVVMSFEYLILGSGIAGVIRILSSAAERGTPFPESTSGEKASAPGGVGEPASGLEVVQLAHLDRPEVVAQPDRALDDIVWEGISNRSGRHG